MMSIKEIKALLDEGKIVVLYKDEDGYAVTEFPPSRRGAQAKDRGDGRSWLDRAMDENERNIINVTYGRMDGTIVATACGAGSGDGSQTAFATTDFRK